MNDPYNYHNAHMPNRCTMHFSLIHKQYQSYNYITSSYAYYQYIWGLLFGLIFQFRFMIGRLV